MDRQILFRGEDEDGRWHEGYYYKECGNVYIIEDRQTKSKLNKNISYKVIPKTICQFTGLTDKNNKKIFEGDIVFHNGFILRKKLLVKFLDGAFCIGHEECGYTEMSSYVTIRDAIAQARHRSKTLSLEIIGNYFDNPELLK